MKILSARQVEYQEFLKTELWKSLRKECYRLARFTCSQCHRSNVTLQAHHKSYPKRFEDTTQDQLECLCKQCHQNIHQHKKHPPKPKPPPKPKYRKLTKKQMKAHREFFKNSIIGMNIHPRRHWRNRDNSSN